MTTSLAGALTAAGASSVLKATHIRQNVTYSLTGAPCGKIELQTSDNGFSWVKAAGAFPGSVSDQLLANPSAQLRFNLTNVAAVTNGAFASDTGWTKGTGWTIGSGHATSDASQSADSLLSQTPAVALIPGTAYSISYATTRNAGTVTCRIGGKLGVARTTGANFTETIVCGVSDGLIAFVGDLDFDGTIDDVVITPTTLWALATTDMVLEQFKDADGTVLRTQTQEAFQLAGKLTVAGSTTLTGSLTTAASPFTSASVGTLAAAATGGTVLEYGDAILHQTRINLFSQNIPVTDALAYASLELYDFPEGRIHVLGVTGSIGWAVTTDRTTTINDNASLTWSLGTVAASNITLSSTMVDLLPKTTKVLAAAVDGENSLSNNALAASAQFDGTATAKKMYLNVGFETNTDIDADGTLQAVEGTIVITWLSLGDY